MSSSRWAGLVEGISTGISEAHDKREARIQQQMEEAKKLSAVMGKRRSEAQEVSQKIKNANARFGVSENTLYSVWKAGQLDDYLGMIESPDMSPQMREALWKMPNESMVDPANGNIYDQIDKAMGVIKQGINTLPERNDYSIGNLLYEAIGGNRTESVNKALTGQTVEGYHVPELLDMPVPEGVNPDPGANYNYDIVKQEEMLARNRKNPPRSGKGVGNVELYQMTPDDVRNASRLIPALVSQFKAETQDNTQWVGVSEESLESAVGALVDYQFQLAGNRRAQGLPTAQPSPKDWDIVSLLTPYLKVGPGNEGRAGYSYIDTAELMSDLPSPYASAGNPVVKFGDKNYEVIEDHSNETPPYMLVRDPANPTQLLRMEGE